MARRNKNANRNKYLMRFFLIFWEVLLGGLIAGGIGLFLAQKMEIFPENKEEIVTEVRDDQEEEQGLQWEPIEPSAEEPTGEGSQKEEVQEESEVEEVKEEGVCYIEERVPGR